MKSQQGFTLIELLIAMSIAAIISMLAYQTIDSGVRVNQSLETHQQELKRLQGAWWWLEQDLIQMAPRAVNDGLGGSLPAMTYRVDLGLEFSRLSDAQSPLAMAGSYGLNRVAYRLENKQLVRLLWPVMDRAPDSVPVRRVLLEDVQRFDLRFLDEQSQWRENWPPENRETPPLNNLLPKAVEVRMLNRLGEVKRLFLGTDWMEFNPYPAAASGSVSGQEGVNE